MATWSRRHCLEGSSVIARIILSLVESESLGGTMPNIPQIGFLLLLGVVPSAVQADEELPTMPLATALNRVWGGHVHCMGRLGADWEEHWNLKNGKSSWSNGGSGQREVAWNGHEFIVSGVRGNLVIDGKGHFDGNAILVDFAFGTTFQCHAKLETGR
jgi:hypothetical protein